MSVRCTSDPSTIDLRGLRPMLEAAWGDKDDEFSDDDRASSTGGTHFVLEIYAPISCDLAPRRRLVRLTVP